MSGVVKQLNAEVSSSSPASESAQNSRTDILNAAAQCFMDNGFSATSIDDVARSLAATKGMIYHHFRSKTDLFFDVYRRGMEINFKAIEQSSRAGESARCALTRMAMAHAFTLMSEQAYQRVLSQGVQLHIQGATTAAQRETLQELIDIRNDYEARFRIAIEAAADESDVDIEDASIASKSFLAVLNSTVFWYSPRSENADEEQSRIACILSNTAMRGVGLQSDPKVLKELGASK